MEEERGILSVGSMFKTSESWYTMIINALLGDTMISSEDWRVQCACAVGAAIVTSIYIMSRARMKGLE